MDKNLDSAAASDAIVCAEVGPDKRERQKLQPTEPPRYWHEAPMRLRAAHLLTIYGVSQTILYDRLRQHKIPAPSGNDGRPYWISTDIAKHISQQS